MACTASPRAAIHTWAYGGSAEYVESLNDVVMAVMIEKKGAVDELEEILEIPELDMVQWGGLGLFHEHRQAGVSATRPRLSPRMTRLSRRLSRWASRRARRFSRRDEAKKYLDMGVRHFSIGTDLAILYGWWKSNGEELLRAMQGE